MGAYEHFQSFHENQYIGSLQIMCSWQRLHSASNR